MNPVDGDGGEFFEENGDRDNHIIVKTDQEPAIEFLIREFNPILQIWDKRPHSTQEPGYLELSFTFQ